MHAVCHVTTWLASTVFIVLCFFLQNFDASARVRVHIHAHACIHPDVHAQLLMPRAQRQFTSSQHVLRLCAWLCVMWRLHLSGALSLSAECYNPWQTPAVENLLSMHTLDIPDGSMWSGRARAVRYRDAPQSLICTRASSHLTRGDAARLPMRGKRSQSQSLRWAVTKHRRRAEVGG